jgi:hypothetical protein
MIQLHVNVILKIQVPFQEQYIYIYIYIHCRKIQNLFVRALETGRKVSLWRDFLACFASSQINFIFNDNVGKLCLSCNIKESKTTAKLFDNS